MKAKGQHSLAARLKWVCGDIEDPEHQFNKKQRKSDPFWRTPTTRFDVTRVTMTAPGSTTSSQNSPGVRRMKVNKTDLISGSALKG